MEYIYRTGNTIYYSLVCQTCGKTYMGKAKNQKYCCDKCKPKRKSNYVPVEKPLINYICHGCGKPFESKYKNQRWCSEECKKKYHEIHCHKERVSKAVHEERICPECGKTFISQNAKSTYCGDICYSHAYNKRLYSCRQEDINKKAVEKKIQILNDMGFDYISGYKNQKSIITIKCQICGTEKEIRADSVRSDRKWSCNFCREESKKTLREEKQKEYEIKKQLLSALKGVQRIKRAEEKESERQKHWEEIHQPRKCKCCEKEFIPNTLHQEKCEACRRQRKEKRVPKEKRNRSLTWKTLWGMGYRTCALCGNECNTNDFITKIGRDGREVIIVGDTYPSLDHIVPVFMGGGDYIDNVQLACTKCNTLRGVREWQEFQKDQKQTLRV